jgi:YqaJ-like viral recombinase domain
MKFHAVEQYSTEWWQVRLGIPTASNFHLFMTPGGKPTAPDNKERRKYLYRLVGERILGEPAPPRFEGNEYTERGRDMEEEAAKAFSKALNGGLAPGGFMTTDDGRYGCSLDRLTTLWPLAEAVEVKAPAPWMRKFADAVEIKAPAPWTHIQYMVEGPGDRYKPQVQGQLMISEFQFIHFWSWHPRFPPVHIVTLPDERYIARLRQELDLFCEELDNVERFVRRQGNVAEVVKLASEVE